MTPLPLTAQELDRLEELAGKATPGPWVPQSEDDGRSGPWWIDTHAYPDGPEPVWAPPQYPVSGADAACIAALHNAAPSLIAAARRETGLDEAWAAAEAALPEGWRIDSLVCRMDSTWLVRARGEWLRVDDHHGRWTDHEVAGPTPAAALRALALALREAP